jgi:hypothetical protein
MATPEPGLDRREWETEWAQIDEELSDLPQEALPAMDDLVTRMLEARGYAVEDDVAAAGIEPEVLTEYRSAHEVAVRVDAGETVDPGDVAQAINSYRALYDNLIVTREAP